MGNILTQTEVGAYLYNASGQNSTRPHATTQVLGTVGQYIDPKYTYDAAGNLQTVSSRNGNGRSHYFTSFNMPESLASTGSNPASAAFIYGTDNQRVKEILARTQNGSVKTRTVYQIHPDNAGGLYYEKEQKEDGSIEHRHYVGGSILITSAGTAPTTITSTKYWHKDHLGSNVAITDAAGAVIERMAYDPFGKRRTTGGAYDQNGTLRGTNTDRGFTGHEHLDDLGFIHMNGRIFDPTLGRFLSADPYIQYADNIQSYNRYSYLFNNPLNATDPTGFFLRKLKKAILHPNQFVLSLVSYKTGSILVSIGSMFCGPFAYLCQGAGTYDNAKAHGLSTSQALRAGVRAGVASYVSMAGDAFSAGNAWYMQALIKGVAGGISAEISGGSFRDGFKYSVAISLLKSGLDAYARSNLPDQYKDGYESSLDTAKGEAYNKPSYDLLHSKDAGAALSACGGGSGAVCNPYAPNAGRAIEVDSVSEILKPVERSSSLVNESGVLARAARSVPGMNAFAVTHDIAMGALQNVIGNGRVFAVLNPLTILPVAYLQYLSLGAGRAIYYEKMQGLQ